MEKSLSIDLSEFPEPLIDIASGDQKIQTAVLAGGCFWCTEAVFCSLEGINNVMSGYIGGDKESATYESVCSGLSNHAEAIKIDFDQDIISYGKILKVFFSIAHDPTQKNRQGNDIGHQYRSAIFYLSSQQKEVAKQYISQLTKAKIYNKSIETVLEVYTEFYPAEIYHRNFAKKNPLNTYLLHSTKPKLDRLNRYFDKLLKK